MANQNKLVTIALAVYNVEPYLKEALDSIVNQTYRNLEILCIDDCSTDGSWQILQEYAQRDNRIRIEQQSHNQGLSVSRTRALNEATGEWILMVDGDDIFALDLVEKAIASAQKNDSDLVLWDYCEFRDVNELDTAKAVPSAMPIDTIDKSRLLKLLAFTWVRLLKVSVAKQIGIYFPTGLTKQDMPAHWLEITLLDKISIVRERLLYYRLRPGATSNKRGKSLMDLITVREMVEKDLRKNQLFEKYHDSFFSMQLTNMMSVYKAIEPQHKAEVKSRILSIIDQPRIQYVCSQRGFSNYRRKVFYRGIAGSRCAWAISNALDALAKVKSNIIKAISRK
ncbi:MAG: glycosyltransferase family 2 protein [Muribaculaceae bacterium]